MLFTPNTFTYIYGTIIIIGTLPAHLLGAATLVQCFERETPNEMASTTYSVCSALNLKYLSSNAYRALCESGMIALPSERTLFDYTHWVTPHTGVQCEFVEQLKLSMESELPSKPHHIALSMDEMKIKKWISL